MRNKLKVLLRRKHSEFIINLGISVQQNPKHFWSFVKSKTKQCSTPAAVTWDTCEASDQVELFNNYFVLVFKAPEIHNINPTGVTYNSFPSELTLREDDVFTILCNLDTNKAVCPDSVSPVILKACHCARD